MSITTIETVGGQDLWRKAQEFFSGCGEWISKHNPLTEKPTAEAEQQYSPSKGVESVSRQKKDQSIFDQPNRNNNNNSGTKEEDAAVKLLLPEAKSIVVSASQNNLRFMPLFSKYKDIRIIICALLCLLASGKDEIKRRIAEIEEMNERLRNISEKIKEMSLKCAQLQKEASEYTYQGEMNEVNSKSLCGIPKLVSSVKNWFTAEEIPTQQKIAVPAAIIGGAAALIGPGLYFAPALSAFLAKASIWLKAFLGAGGIALGKKILSATSPDAVARLAIEAATGAPKLKAASKSAEASELQAQIQKLKDEQGCIQQDISTKQHELSLAEQTYSSRLNILQTIIAAWNEAMKATAAGIHW